MVDLRRASAKAPRPRSNAATLSRTYNLGGESVPALRGVSFRIERGEFVAIMGASGSGKSTLLNLLGALDKPTSGEIVIDGESVSAMGDDELAALRSRKIGFVFQQFNLLPRMSALENVILPLNYSRDSAWTRRRAACAGLRKWAWRRACITGPRSSRAGSSSASPSPAPSSTIRASFWPTSRRALSTPRLRKRSCGLFSAFTRMDSP